MKISIKSSEESQELLIEDTFFKRTVDFQTKDQHELPTDYEFAEGSLSDMTEKSSS